MWTGVQKFIVMYVIHLVHTMVFSWYNSVQVIHRRKWEHSVTLTISLLKLSGKSRQAITLIRDKGEREVWKGTKFNDSYWWAEREGKCVACNMLDITKCSNNNYELMPTLWCAITQLYTHSCHIQKIVWMSQSLTKLVVNVCCDHVH